VERALERLHEPEYGVCADCGEDIPYARLAASPFATRCTACQERAEHVLTEAAPPALTRG
jgi:RNA polymerase-binding transcription factor DksA